MLSARAATSVMLVLLALLAGAPDASALTRDARQACGVTSEDPVGRTAAVPAENQEEPFQFVVDANADLYLELLCGKGTTTGAVHIEVKHDVPNWGDGLTAIRNTIRRGKASPGDNGKSIYTWAFAPGRTMTVVVGDRTIITAYPTDGREETWVEASTAA